MYHASNASFPHTAQNHHIKCCFVLVLIFDIKMKQLELITLDHIFTLFQ